MKIAIDISPLQTGHKVRGVGFYLKHLKDALLKYHSEHEYYFFTEESEIPKDIDIVHYPYFEPFFVTLPFIKKHKRVVTVHDLTPLVFPEHFPAGVKGGISWQVQKWNLKNSEAIITDSQSSSKDVAKYTGISTKKIHSIYLAAAEEFMKIKDQKRIKDVFNKYNLPEKFALYVGDVTWNKNLPRLIKAIKQINVPLVMVGKALTEKNFDRTNIWNKDLIEVHKLIEDDNLFHSLGFVSQEDLVTIYNAASVFVFPSHYEGFGLPVLEAMQCGLPVVTTKEGSLSEIAETAAYFVDNNDTDNIADGINKVFKTKSLQEELSKKGLAQADKFNWKKTSDETILVYERMLNIK